MDDHGNAIASWQWWDGAYLVVQAALRPAAGPWAAPETLSATGRDATRPRLAMDAAGNALVGWLRFDGSWTPGQVAYKPAGKAWEPPHNMSERSGRTHGLQLALNRRGDALVVWVQGGAPWSSSRPAGAARLGARMTLLSEQFYHYYWGSAEMEIALDEEGDATVVQQRSFFYKQPGRQWEEGWLWESDETTHVRTTVTADKPRDATAVAIHLGEDDDRIDAVSYDAETAQEQAKEAEEESDEEGDEDGEFELLRGTPGADVLMGTPGNDLIYGLGGADRIDGRGGNDVIYGGNGPDRIAGGPGSDVLIGGWDRDVLRGNAGNDRLRGRDGIPDTMFGGRGRDRVRFDRWLDRNYSVELVFR
jgi:Ca2+-binding RTX toxin-like protein